MVPYLSRGIWVRLFLWQRQPMGCYRASVDLPGVRTGQCIGGRHPGPCPVGTGF
jgi:hypothetical protein